MNAATVRRSKLRQTKAAASFRTPGCERMVDRVNFGVYIHIPFCRTRCTYCSFVIRPWQQETADRYCGAVVRELEHFFADDRSWGTADTIYFGGGTPSLVPESDIARILGACRRLFDVAPDCEISLEANPETVTGSKIDAYRELGVNRISIGAQTFEDAELARLGRAHTSQDIARSLILARERGLENLNLDLLLGLPGQTPRHWTRNLQQLSNLAPPHVSLYMLDLDPKVPLYHSVATGASHLPDDDLVCDGYLRALRELADCGYEQYEISNFAFHGFPCRHNLKYWLRQPVLGFGLGSHSFDGRSRYANVSVLPRYFGAVEGGNSPVEWQRPVNDWEDLQETLFLGLRLRQGLNWDQVESRFGRSRIAKYQAALKTRSDEGLVEWQDSWIRLTPRGMLLSNEIFQDFI
jgi:oxygen-independent coproporphyrinogen-3 oxidase